MSMVSSVSDANPAEGDATHANTVHASKYVNIF
jgi:hypothetical protein